MDNDVDELYKDKTNIYTVFEKSSDMLYKIIEKYIKDRDGKLLLETIKNNEDISQSE